MKKLFLSITLLCFLAVSLMSQSQRVEVTVHKKDGSTEEAMMFVNPDAPWTSQKSISVFDRSLKDEKRIKKKYKTKYKAKAIAGYEVDGIYYESKKVMITTRGDKGNSLTLKGLPNYALIERVTEGPITVYMAYAYPQSVASGDSFDEIYEDLRNNPTYFLMKESDMKVKSMHGVNIEKWIADAPETSEKFANGEFGNFKRKKKKKLGSFIKGQMENENPTLIISIVEAYNAEMQK